MTDGTPTGNRVSYYNRLLRSRPGSSFEAAGESAPDLSGPAIENIMVSTGAELRRIVQEEIADNPEEERELLGLVDEYVADGDAALKVLRDGDEQGLQDPAIARSLEVVVRSDGSRPSFLIREGDVARTTSPLGDWGTILDDVQENLKKAIACVGRIDDPNASQGFQGTGWLVQENLIITNRHVLQAVASRQPDGTWQFNDDVKIDFGHEHRGQATVTPRALKRVVYAGSKPITDPLVHSKIDLALIEIEPSDGGAVTSGHLDVDVSTDWDEPGKTMFIIGYPGQPPLGAEPPSVLELLFRTTFGHKRLAPGWVMPEDGDDALLRVAHDATTLGGNSGSVVLVLGREGLAAGLHYGGSRADPRQNWGHVMGNILDKPGDGSSKTLREHFAEHNVNMVDPGL